MFQSLLLFKNLLIIIYCILYIFKGENGVRRVLEILRDEFSLTMALAGKYYILSYFISTFCDCWHETSVKHNTI